MVVPTPRVLSGLDAAAVRFDEVLDDGEAEARPAERPRAGGVHPVEPLEDARQVFAGDADPGVADLDLDAARSRGGGDGDVPAVGRVADGVVEHVEQRLARRLWVGDQRRAAHRAGERQPRRVGPRLERAPDLFDQRRQRYALRARRPGARLDAREVEQVVHQLLHAPRVGQHLRHEIAAYLRRHVLAGEGLRVAANHGERRLQLVRHVGHEVPPDRLEPPQPGDVVQDQHGAAPGERMGGEQHAALVHLDLEDRGFPAGQGALDHVVGGAVAEQLQGRRRHRVGREVEQAARCGVEHGHGPHAVERDDALGHRGHQRRHLRALALQLAHAPRQAFVERAQRACQVAHLVAAARVDHGTLTAGDGLGGVAQPEERARHGAREAEGQEPAHGQRQQPAEQDGVLRVLHGGVHLRQRRGDADRAARDRHRHLQLPAPGGHAVADVGAGAAGEGFAELRAGGVVLERGQLVAREVGIRDHEPRGVDHGEAAPGGPPELVHEGIAAPRRAGCPRCGRGRPSRA